MMRTQAGEWTILARMLAVVVVFLVMWGLYRLTVTWTLLQERLRAHRRPPYDWDGEGLFR